MLYSLKFIIELAESKFGKNNKKAIDKYVTDFDPDKQEFAEDIRNYHLTVAAETAKKEENEFRYRILQDVRYLRIVYSGKAPCAEELRKPITTAVKDVYNIKNAFSCAPVDYKSGEKKYLLYSVELQKKYGFHHDAKNVVEVIKDLCVRENANESYRSYFEALFAATYCVATDKEPNVMELFTDFDNFMTEVLKAEIAPLAENRIDVKSARHGGLEGKELVEFLNGYAALSDSERVTDRLEKKPPEAADAVKTK